MEARESNIWQVSFPSQNVKSHVLCNLSAMYLFISIVRVNHYMERKKLCYEFFRAFYPFGYALNIGSLITGDTRKNVWERMVRESDHTKRV